MARSRNIKPSFFKNEILGVSDPLLSLLFASLWTLADREGRLEDRPLRIKAETFPYRDIHDFNGYLTQLEQHGFIERYRVGDIAIIQVVNFRKHQAPHNTEKASELPEKPIDSPVTVKAPVSSSDLTQAKRSDSLILIPDSLNSDSGISNPIGLHVISDAADCPHQEILKIYSEILPELPQPRSWEGQRRKNLSSRWKWVLQDLKKRNLPNGRAEGIDFFRRMFEYVGKSDFLMGRIKPWSADLGWMVKAVNFENIIQGNYENKAKA